MTPEEQQRTRQGILLAVGAYTMWGIAPIYFKSLSDVAPLEILSHRVVWSFFLLAFLLHIGRSWRKVRDTLTSKPKMLYLVATSILVGANWLIFIWAVNSNHMLDASLGYYINPLINVLLGMLFLGERLRKLQWFAVALAAIGVLIQLIAFGSVPIVAIALAFSFGFYGLLRKQLVVEAVPGLFVETLIVLPIALSILGWMQYEDRLVFGHQSLQTDLLLVAAGLVTTFPLLFFAGAARRLPLSMMGFIQYLAPSITFALAVFVYHEPLDSTKMITFAMIWFGLLLFTGESRWSHRQKRLAFVKTEADV